MGKYSYRNVVSDKKQEKNILRILALPALVVGSLFLWDVFSPYNIKQDRIQQVKILSDRDHDGITSEDEWKKTYYLLEKQYTPDSVPERDLTEGDLEKAAELLSND